MGSRVILSDPATETDSALARKCKCSRGLEVIVGNFAVLCEKPLFASLGKNTQVFIKHKKLLMENERE